MRNRLASEHDYVMLDENLVNELSKAPLYIRPHSKVRLGIASFSTQLVHI